MAPGPKKKSFHTPRNPKNTQISKKNVESNNEVDKSVDISSNLTTDSEIGGTKKYSKRSVASNWDKYEEPQIDPHADSMRGSDFEVLLSYSGGSGSQLKLKEEKEWEDEALNMKEISMNLKELITCMKCVPFHERIGIQNIFNEKQIMNFISSSEKWKMSYKTLSVQPNSEPKDIETSINSDLIIEEPESPEPDDYATVKIAVQDKTENIINSLASNLSFEKFTEKVEAGEKKDIEQFAAEQNTETTSNDLDFLLSLNISSKLSVKEENLTPKTANVDDWLNSILDD